MAQRRGTPRSGILTLIVTGSLLLGHGASFPNCNGPPPFVAAHGC